MADEDDFKVRVGRVGKRPPRAPSYARRLRIAIEREGRGGLHGTGAGFEGGNRRQPRSSFTGARTGRGYAYGALASSRRPAPGQRRVIVKARLVRLKAGDLGTARAHLRYIQRDGVTREGSPGELYDRDGDRADASPFAARGARDRHHFRFIVAPEDAGELADLKPFVRDLMRQMEGDLGTSLDWVAVDHHNTGHPHTHIVVRGRDDGGKDLVIARDYIAHGLRERASELITRELGPETELDQMRKLENEVGAERLTRLDRELISTARDGIVKPSREARDGRHLGLRTGRLRTLEKMGLATELKPGSWQLVGEAEDTLRQMGERGDIIKTMHRELKAAGLKRGTDTLQTFDPAGTLTRVTGRVVTTGFADELDEARYAIVDGTDGRVHYVDLGKPRDEDLPKPGQIVDVSPREIAVRQTDRTIAKVAAAHSGHYSAALHELADPAASSEYIQSHVRRLEAMRRAGLATRLVEGAWAIPPDHLERALRFEEASRQVQPVRIRIASSQKLAALPRAVGATWLDQQLSSATPVELATSGFGAEVRNALRLRQQWLVERGLAWETEDVILVGQNLTRDLMRFEVNGAAERIAKDSGLRHVEVRKGQTIRGTVRQTIELVSGHFTMIEGEGTFALVPWRQVLDRAIGRAVEGIAGGEGISWSIGIKRGIGR